MLSFSISTSLTSNKFPLDMPFGNNSGGMHRSYSLRL
jgi:hypothetical protein